MKSTSAKMDILLNCFFCKEGNPLDAKYCHMCGHIIDLSTYEDAILNKNKLPYKIRIRVARETCKEEVMLRCVRDSAVSVFNALKQNPNLTYKVREAIQKKEYQSPSPMPTSIPSTPSPSPSSSVPESGGFGCFWFIVMLCIIGGVIFMISNG